MGPAPAAPEGFADRFLERYRAASPGPVRTLRFARLAWPVAAAASVLVGAWLGLRDGPVGERSPALPSPRVVEAIDPKDLIFEAPTKSAQAWFVNQFGPAVNLGNIPPEEVIPLETLRLGLRGDTLKEMLSREHAEA